MNEKKLYSYNKFAFAKNLIFIKRNKAYLKNCIFDAVVRAICNLILPYNGT